MKFGKSQSKNLYLGQLDNLIIKASLKKQMILPYVPKYINFFSFQISQLLLQSSKIDKDKS